MTEGATTMNEQTQPPVGAENDITRRNLSLETLERQVERGSFFTHTALGRASSHLREVESFTYGILDVLLAKQIVSSEEVSAAVENIRRETAANGEIPGPGVALRLDPPEQQNGAEVKVDCAARMHICHAICCRLDFALTHEEVESGKIKWDLGRPYFIRHEAHGGCTHQDCKSGGCRVYADRPAICRTYSCAKDTRIWKDFEKMELNTEWIEQHLTPSSGPRLIGALMQNAENSGEVPAQPTTQPAVQQATT